MDFFTYEVIAVLVISWLILYPILLFIPWYKWWNTNDPKRQYNCISFAKLAYFKYNYPLFIIMNNLWGSTRFEEDWWVFFINSVLIGEAIGVVDQQPGSPPGLCTPKTLCESLIPTQYPSGFLPIFGRQWPTQPGDWKKLLLAWTGMATVPTDPSNWKPDLTTWNNTDNFLAAWGISPNSPIVIGFITGKDSFNGQTTYITAINPLLGYSTGGTEGYGGFIGFLQASSGSFNSLNSVNNAIWGQEPIPTRIINAQDAGKKCSGSSVVSGALGTGMGAAFAGAAFGGSAGLAGGPFAWVTAPIGAAIGFIIGAIVGGTVGAWGGNCL